MRSVKDFLWILGFLFCLNAALSLSQAHETTEVLVRGALVGAMLVLLDARYMPKKESAP